MQILPRKPSPNHGTFVNLTTGWFMWDKASTYFSLTLVEIFFFLKTNKNKNGEARITQTVGKTRITVPFSESVQLSKQEEGTGFVPSFWVTPKIRDQDKAPQYWKYGT